jgi:endonuclease III
VKNGVADVAKLMKLVKKVGGKDPVPSAGPSSDGSDPIEVLIYSFLLWEATAKQADDAMAKIRDSIVDFNDLRVFLPNEIVTLIGARYPLALERAQRMKTSLHSIYLGQHVVSLDHLASAGKREAKALVEALEGIPPYVSARVLQRCFDVHVIPVDDRLVDLLIEAKVLSEIVDSGDLSSWMSRQVKSVDGHAFEATIRSFVDESPKPPRRPTPKPVKKPEPVVVVEEEVAPPPKAASKKTSSKSEKAIKKVPSSVKKAAKKTAKKSAKNVPDKVAKKTTKKSPAKTAVKKPVKKAAKKTVKKSVVKKATKKVTKKTTKKVAKKTAKKAGKKKAARK